MVLLNKFLFKFNLLQGVKIVGGIDSFILIMTVLNFFLSIIGVVEGTVVGEMMFVYSIFFFFIQATRVVGFVILAMSKWDHNKAVIWLMIRIITLGIVLLLTFIEFIVWMVELGRSDATAGAKGAGIFFVILLTIIYVIAVIVVDLYLNLCIFSYWKMSDPSAPGADAAGLDGGAPRHPQNTPNPAIV